MYSTLDEGARRISRHCSQTYLYRRLTRDSRCNGFAGYLPEQFDRGRPQSDYVAIPNHAPLALPIRKKACIVSNVSPPRTRACERKRRFTCARVTAQQNSSSLPFNAGGMHWGRMTIDDMGEHRRFKEVIFQVTPVRDRSGINPSKRKAMKHVDDIKVRRIGDPHYDVVLRARHGSRRTLRTTALHHAKLEQDRLHIYRLAELSPVLFGRL